MHSRSQSHGYESLLLLVIVVMTVMSAFIAAVHYGNLDVVDSIKNLIAQLQSTDTIH